MILRAAFRSRGDSEGRDSMREEAAERNSRAARRQRAMSRPSSANSSARFSPPLVSEQTVIGADV